MAKNNRKVKKANHGQRPSNATRRNRNKKVITAR